MRCRSAFTLIELLVVIAIIAILAAILFPVFAQAKVAAKKTSELSDIKQQILASLMYCNDYDDDTPIIPFAFTQGWAAPSGDPANWNLSWPQEIDPYVKSAGLFLSPLDPAPTTDFGGWVENTDGQPNISYTINALSYVGDGATGLAVLLHNSPGGFAGMCLPAGDTSTGYGNAPNPGVLSTTSFTSPASTVAFAPRYNGDTDKETGWPTLASSGFFPFDDQLSDSNNLDSTAGSGYYGFDAGIPDGNCLAAAVQAEGQMTGSPTVCWGGISNQNGSSNLAWADGHAKFTNLVSTNPDGLGQPQNNKWLSHRPGGS